MIDIWTDSALIKHMKDSRPAEGAAAEIALSMARNEAESAQILVRCATPFVVEAVAFEELDGLVCGYLFQETIVFQDGVEHPDPLSNNRTVTVDADSTQGIWVTFRTPAALPAGQYRGRVCVSTAGETLAVPVCIRVYDVVLPDSRDAAFSLEYWVNTVGFWWRRPAAEQRDFIKQYYGCEKYTDAWWKVVGAIAGNMLEHRINVLLVRTQDLLLDGGTVLEKDGRYSFVWDRFDQYIQFFLDRGVVKHLAGFHIIRQTEGEYVYVISRGAGGVHVVADAPIGSAEGIGWLDQFLPALHRHLQEKGWLPMWLQHVEDEPAQATHWTEGREAVRRHMPGVLCLDAIDNQAPCADLQSRMDLWIPRIDIYEDNRAFYDYRLTLGEQRWTYTCCVPNTPNYMNKFIDRPYWHNRLLFWGCFARGMTGFLHWGYNHWDSEDEWFGLNSKAYFKGDGYIVYPDPENFAVKSSARLINTRDSAEDYELLRIVADRDPALACALAGRLVGSFHDFTWDTALILKVREELLQAAESVCNEERKDLTI